MRSLLLAAAFALASAPAAPAFAAAVEAPAGSRACFYSNQWQGWRAPDDKHLYLRTGVKDVFRAEFASACHGLRSPGATLLTEVRGSSLICSPLDLDIKVSTSPEHGFFTPCIVKSLRKLTPDEAKALPKEARP